MGFIMDSLEAEAYDRTYSDNRLIARIIGYFRHQSPDYKPGEGFVPISRV